MIVIATLTLGFSVSPLASASTAPAREGEHTAAFASRVQKIVERTQMHLASAPGVTIKEVGTVTGTYSGTVVAYVTSYSVSRGLLVITAYFHGGAITVRGETRNRVAGSTGYSEGTGRITHGTGKFAKASSNSLYFRALVNRQNFHSTAEVHGPMSF